MSTAAETAVGERPSSVRFRVLAVCCLSSVLLYLDRFCINFADRYVREDLGIDNDALGWSMFAFFITYALFQIPSGWLTDRYGPRRMLTVYILAWSLFTGLMGAVGSLLGLIAVRLLAGVSQAGAYPTCAAVVRQWMPLSRRGIASSVIAFGGRFGGGIAPVLTALLIIAFVPMEVSPLLTEADILRLPTTTVPDGASRLERTRHALARELLDKVRVDGRPPGDSAAFARGCNDLIDGPVLLPADRLAEISPEKEADRLFRRSERTDAERRRLNRLILEAVFKDQIRKLYVQGWRPVMFLYGMLGIPMAWLFLMIVRDAPRLHPHVNRTEAELIGVAAAVTRSSFPWRGILRNRSLWLLNVGQFGTNLGWAFLVTWLPRYLDEVHQVPFAQRGLMVSIPIFCGWPGVLCGGWLTDTLVRRFGLRWGRVLPMGLTKFAGCVCFLALLLEPGPWTAIALFAVVAFSTDSGTAAVWSVSQDMGGPYTASVLGWSNMWGNIGAALSPVVAQQVMKSFGWNGAWCVFALAFMAAGVCALLIDPRRAVDGSAAA